jgi:aldehyde dehydrogenase (NAD+)
VVERDANINIAAKRIAVTKFSNAGQMCIAPDYVLVHHSVKDAFLQALKQCITKFFSDNPATDYSYGKIINHKQFARLTAYLTKSQLVHGGHYDEEALYIEPAILDNVSPDDPVMQEEIFGPLLPVIGFETMEEAKAIISRHPDPLAFYLYTGSSKQQKNWLEQVPAGGVCINNCSWHFTNHHLPFGGRGNSGLGVYHGRNSFETFSHRKAVMKTPTWFDPAVKYPPFKGKLKLFKWIIR